jgi:SAM-dependent MidA family methyltransferase
MLNQVFERIAAEISTCGAISCARFMELALYCPVYGYYEKEEDRIGRRGDYYTSVSVGGLFGELLAFQFAEWLAEDGMSGGANERVQLVEAGAHWGNLAGDILGWLRERRPALFGRLDYVIVEPSERRRQWQQRTLEGFGNQIQWVENLSAFAPVPQSASGSAPTGMDSRRPQRVQGIIFSNELLDALPVHRFGWDARQRRWFEWGVTLAGDELVWTRLPGDTQVQPPNLSIPASDPADPTETLRRSDAPTLLDVLPDGFTTEVCPAAVEWWRQAASALECGKLLTMDYGLVEEEWFAPERPEGTLRAYYQHRLNPDVLANPGAQDLTAHVNFSAIQDAGEAAGLKTERFLNQAQFLTGIAARIWEKPSGFGPWTPERTRQFKTLTHPEHLGRVFKVLVQSTRS